MLLSLDFSLGLTSILVLLFKFVQELQDGHADSFLLFVPVLLRPYVLLKALEFDDLADVHAQFCDKVPLPLRRITQAQLLPLLFRFFHLVEFLCEIKEYVGVRLDALVPEDKERDDFAPG